MVFFSPQNGGMPCVGSDIGEYRMCNKQVSKICSNFLLKRCYLWKLIPLDPSDHFYFKLHRKRVTINTTMSAHALKWTISTCWRGWGRFTISAEGTGFLVLFFSNFKRIIKFQPNEVVVYKLKILYYARYFKQKGLYQTLLSD